VDATAADNSERFLVDEVLLQVQVGKVIIGVTGQGVVKKDKESGYAQTEPLKSAIEAPYLQLVMTRIRNDEATVTTHELETMTS
jgi:hypothetical protein